jgi:hypothetical protein
MMAAITMMTMVLIDGCMKKELALRLATRKTRVLCFLAVCKRDSDQPPTRPPLCSLPRCSLPQAIFVATSIRGADVPRVDCAAVVLAKLAALAAHAWRHDGAIVAAATAAGAGALAPPPQHERLHQHDRTSTSEPDEGGVRAYLFNEHYILKPLRSEYEFRWHRDAAEQLAMCFDQSYVVLRWCW